MSGLYRKILVVFMLLWLPLASGSAIASSIGMQLLHGKCDDASVMQKSGHLGHAMHKSMTDNQGKGHAQTCHTCGACQFACGLMVMSSLQVNLLAVSRISFHYLDTFKSNLTVPLLPPPLARA